MTLRIVLISIVLTLGLGGLLMLVDLPADPRADLPADIKKTASPTVDATPRPYGYFNQELADRLAAEVLIEPYESLKSIHQPVAKPGPNDWLYQHPERNFTFAEYKLSQPVKANQTRRIIYLQPIGAFNPSQQQILDQTADFMGRFFGVPVRIKPGLPAEVIPAAARRRRAWGEQFLSTWILDELLKPSVDETTLALVALTATDLWPGDGWNFVFGQASLADRIGVWSFQRNGDPADSDTAFRTSLLRTLKTAVHETGHILSMKHCLAFACVMNGSNNLTEADSQPLALCPICLRKLTWNTNTEPSPRYESLKRYCEQAGLKEHAAFYQQALTITR